MFCQFFCKLCTLSASSAPTFMKYLTKVYIDLQLV